MAAKKNTINFNESLDNFIAIRNNNQDISVPDIRRTIIKHALLAATVSGTIGIVPGGSFVANSITLRSTSSMYRKITGDIKLPLHMNILKKAGSMILTKTIGAVMTQVVSVIAYLIPGAGNLVAAGLCATSAFATVYISGYLFVILLERMCKHNSDKKNSSLEDTIESHVTDLINEADFGALIKEAKAVHKSVKNDKELNNFTDIEDEVNNGEALISA